MSNQRIAECIDLCDWRGALNWCNSQDRLGVLEEFWAILRPREQSDLFAFAYQLGDNPTANRAFVLDALRDLEESGRRSFCSPYARRAFNRLPRVVTVYRGGVVDELGTLGTSWTLRRSVAVFFATKHGRFRNVDSAPCVFSAEIDRDRIRAYFTSRKEREAVLDPQHLRELRHEILADAVATN